MGVVVDVGSGLTKVIYGDDKRKFYPSVVGETTIDEMFHNDGEISHEVIFFENSTYLIGEKASANINIENRYKTTVSNFSENKGTLLLHLSAIALAYPNGINGTVPIVTGIPMGKFKKGSSKESFIKNLSGTYYFKTKTAEYNITISKNSILVIPQALGLYFSCLGGPSRGLNWKDQIVSFIDLGTYTCGMCSIEYGNLSSNHSDSVNIGMSHLAESVKKQLKTKYNISFKDQTRLLRGLRSGEINVFDPSGTKLTVDMYKETQTIVPETFAAILEWVNNHWEINNMYIFISGGGSRYLFNELKKTVPHIKLLNAQKLVKTTGKEVKDNAKDPIEKSIYDVVNGFSIYAENCEFFKKQADVINEI